MAVTARGQITITDLNDARNVNMFLSSNQPLTQVFSQDGKKYSPDYVSTNLVITPEMYVSGISEDQMGSLASAPTWTINGSSTLTDFGATVGNAASHYALTIKQNMATVDQLHIVCTATWRDSVTGLSVPVRAEINFTKNINTGSLAFARIDASSLVFKKVGGVATPPSITLAAVLVRGGQDDTTPTDATSYAVKWMKYGSTASLGRGRTLTVNPSDVTNIQTYVCQITDTSSTSGTNGKTFTATVTIADMTDPYQCTITSDNGTTFVNNSGSNIVLTAHLFNGGVEITDTTKFTCAWSKILADGTSDGGFADPGTVSLTVKPSDVAVKATYVCTVTLK